MIIKNLGKVVGDSAYETWLKQGNTGTEQDFLNSLCPSLDGYATIEYVDNKFTQEIDNAIGGAY